MEALEVLYRAMASPLGIVVAVSDFQLCSQRLYAARRKALDTSLECLQIKRSPYSPESEIWVVKTSPKGAKSKDAPHGN